MKAKMSVFLTIMVLALSAMKKKVICTFCLSLTFLILPCFALAQTDPNWLIGNWTGTIFTKDKHRSLEVLSVGTLEAKGAYAITGGKMILVPIKVDGSKVDFETPAKSKISLVKASDTRMDGNFVSEKGKEFKIRFWKNPHLNPPSLDPLMGEWTGQWKVGNDPPRSRFVVEFADSSVASILYEWSDFIDGFGKSYKAGWFRRNAKVISEKSVEFEEMHPEGKLTFRFELKNGTLMGKVVTAVSPH